MFFTKSYFTIFFFVILFCFSKCNNNNAEPKPAVLEKKDTILYTIQTPTELRKTERDSIFYASKMFYDTTLLPSAFNGGILVAKGGNIIFEKYKGFLNLDSVEKINENTPLHIASVSKTFTAMAILKLQELGKLNINDSVVKYFSNFNYTGVTIKTLLNHRSGLPNYLHFLKEVGWPDSVMLKNEDILHLIIANKNTLPPASTADTRFAYCNTNYALLALIIEKVSGMSYPAFMQKNIFTAIGMKNTFVHFDGDNKIVAKSFDWKGRPILNTNLDGIYGDKNIYSTPKDLLKWDRILADSIFLNNNSKALAYAPYSNEKPGIKNYGLGWRMNIYPDGKKIIFHNGWWHGNNAAFIRLVNDDVTIIAMSNRFARQVYGSKILVNIFDNYFTEKAEEDENVMPTNVPEKFSPAKKKEEVKSYDFSDRNAK